MEMGKWAENYLPSFIRRREKPNILDMGVFIIYKKGRDVEVKAASSKHSKNKGMQREKT